MAKTTENVIHIDYSNKHLTSIDWKVDIGGESHRGNVLPSYFGGSTLQLLKANFLSFFVWINILRGYWHLAVFEIKPYF